jgi:uncharacterized protein YndB with AHSA1/START domain
MPANKDFKRLVRARMRKTGEAYTAARARLLQKHTRRQPAPPTATPATPDYATLAGLSDATIKAKTGCTWERWVHALDRVDAHEWPHREIAAYCREKYKVSGWWSQWVTTGYERIKGLRAIGQHRGGDYEVNKTKVVAVPIGRLYRAVHDARTRRRWLGPEKLAVRTATRDKTIRVTWPDGTSVVFYFMDKGDGKSQVAVQHGKLPDHVSAERMKAFWGERLGVLQALLVPKTRAR